MEADTAEEAYVVAREAGFQGSTEDFQKMVQDELAKSSVNELTDKDLEAVAGGGMDKEKWRSMWRKFGPKMMEQMKEKQGVTEELKMQDQMAWVGRMNNIRACAGEIVVKKIVYA